MPPSRLRRWWLLHLMAFFLVTAGWALALPANGTYDEKDHVARAYAVLTGQLTARHTVIDRRDDVKPAFLVPASLLPPNANIDCAWSPRPARSAACQRWTTDRTRILTPSGAAKYSPVYYVLVGAPLVAVPDLTGIVVSRLLSALVSALLLAGAVGAALRLGSRLLVLAIVLATTPMAVNLAGSVNPNGIEITAGVLVYCALLALLRAPDERLSGSSVRRLLLLAGTGSLLLLTVRQLGPVLLALIVVACLPLARPGRLGLLWRRADTRWILGGSWLLGVAASAGWLAYSGMADVAAIPRDAQHLTLAEQAHQLATWRIPFYLKQLAGQFGYGETSLSPVVILLWYLLFAALVVPCLAHGGRRLALVTAAIAAAGLGLLVALELHYLPSIGWFAQGRYAMPALVGVLLCAASAPGFELWLLRRRQLRLYTGALTGTAAVLHVSALAVVMTRFQSGPGASLNPFTGSWLPPAGPVLPLLVTATGVALFAVMAGVLRPAWRPVATTALSPALSPGR